jgi:predicted O-methyltransferase YrrM
MNTFRKIIPALMVLITLSTFSCYSQQSEQKETDLKVEAFLDKHSRSWYDMNIPSSDGKLLYDLIIKNNYTSALEIGTSTGHSSIWIAWALSKTGGKLITVELDERRYNQALANFKEAGLDHIIDARLGDAHELVPELEGPFDFVFSDADKYWYKNYFLAVDPKLKTDGCYTTHNVSDRGGRGQNRDYLQFLLELDHYETTVDNRGGGMAISYKRSAE